jgi:hypothetical protein
MDRDSGCHRGEILRRSHVGEHVIGCGVQEEDRQSMADVGFIGLGAMGSRMANRLLDK